MIYRSPQEKRDARLARGNTHRVANQLRRYFAPNSVLPPPGSTRGATGNRNVTQTAANSPNTTPTDQDFIQLVPTATPGNGASATWRFSTQFQNPPVVTATFVGKYPGGSGGSAGTPQELHLQGRGNTVGAVILSSADDDARLIHVQAQGNPS